ncbi:type II secretion system protein GspM [Lichenifustis flavocetrariae]|uniref:Type II secretion system protein GspM n=1 Tax=Lichenifustis flavocetrariae TaxID=2949735 RepID=A0AA42CIR5_9HYPH|nr:type II secretion system protein GspM [Lichenifustis flavocetrariae]MCW6508823.1 type II secretion system protein GspM [Lichenifustis flavocetrariae]
MMTIIAAARPSRSAGQGWRLAAIGLFLGLPLLLAVVAGLNLAAASDASESADRAEATARTIVRQVERARTGPENASDLSSIYLASPNVSLARAELQAMTAKLVETAGAHLIETQSVEATEQTAAGRISVQLTLDISNPGLLDLLYAIETSVPLLTVPDLNARAEADPESKADGSGLLRVTMTVQGAWKALAP